MTTYEQRELAGVSPINESTLPAKSKYESNKDYKKDHEMAIYQRDLRELDNYQIMEYQHDLTDALGNPYEMIKNQLKEGDYKTITKEEAMYVPYAHYKQAA